MYLVCVVRFNDQGVQMSVNIILATNVFVDQEILAIVAEDNMYFLSSWSTDVGSCIKVNITVKYHTHTIQYIKLYFISHLSIIIFQQILIFLFFCTLRISKLYYLLYELYIIYILC